MNNEHERDALGRPLRKVVRDVNLVRSDLDDGPDAEKGLVQSERRLVPLAELLKLDDLAGLVRLARLLRPQTSLLFGVLRLESIDLVKGVEASACDQRSIDGSPDVHP